MPDAATDPRLDPRVRAFLQGFPSTQLPDVASREELMAQSSTPEAKAAVEMLKAGLDMMDNEDSAPSDGLEFSDHTFTSSPDGNTVNIQLIKPSGQSDLPCVYYIHGGGMVALSCYYGNYKAWGRVMAAAGMAVAMVDFRNAQTPSSVPEVAPFPAGLNDCVSGVKWLSDNAGSLGIDPSKIIMSGESGGGNLTLATAMSLKNEGRIDLVKGLYVLCPYIVGKYPDERFPTTTENNGYVIEIHSNRGLMAYGIEAFEAKDPLAWPMFAGEDDLKGLPPTMISLNECDPLRDEGLQLYRNMMAAGVPTLCRQVMGTAHAIEIFPPVCPDISRDTAANMAHFLKKVSG
ncbi:MAG: alpha/beta hydrolase fold domain-containing protein [Pseudomonadota bacterium]